MRSKKEILEAISKLHYKARKGLINAYEADLCIGALNWVLNNEGHRAKWFKYKVGEKNNDR